MIERLPKSGRLNGNIITFVVKKSYRLGRINEADLMRTFDDLKYNPGDTLGKEKWRIVIGTIAPIGRKDFKAFKKANPDRVREVMPIAIKDKS